MSQSSLLESSPVADLRNLGFLVDQDGFTLTASFVTRGGAVYIIADIDGVRAYGEVVLDDAEEGDTTGTLPVIPWSVLISLRMAIEQALLDKAKEITARKERVARYGGGK